jgi:hypothetical protein
MDRGLTVYALAQSPFGTIRVSRTRDPYIDTDLNLLI